ncbi:MAG: NAD(P)H-binding protein [Acidimicrobiia bacterium]|nr:NAD(P)H-binding protein [Acidimicrobiia bacterium]
MTARVLVTGGSGFLGGFVTPLLAARGYEVLALARTAAAAAVVSGRGARPVLGDLDDPRSLDAAFDCEADALVNLASLGFGHAPGIVAAAEGAGLARVVFVSTTSIFTTVPAATTPVRVEAEHVIRSSGLEWTIIRPTMIYGGAGDRNLWRLLRLLRRSPVVPLPGGGDRLQQPVHGADLAHAIVSAVANASAVGHAYNIGGPRPLTLRELVLAAGHAVGRRPRLVPVPLAPAVAGLRAYERLSARPLLRAEQLRRLEEDKSVDLDDARRDLGFGPRSFAEGIAEEAALLP